MLITAHHEVHISTKKYTENCKMFFFPNRSEMTLAAACVNAFHVHFLFVSRSDTVGWVIGRTYDM